VWHGGAPGRYRSGSNDYRGVVEMMPWWLCSWSGSNNYTSIEVSMYALYKLTITTGSFVQHPKGDFDPCPKPFRTLRSPSAESLWYRKTQCGANPPRSSADVAGSGAVGGAAPTAPPPDAAATPPSSSLTWTSLFQENERWGRLDDGQIL